MPTAQLYTDDLLDPISSELPAGVEMRWTPEWDRIAEARRSDDSYNSDKWEKKERKIANWPLVRDLTTTLLRERSKDLQLALWLTEASVILYGFAGLRDGLRITRELMVRYWDNGLFPPIEQGVEDRSGPFEWLNDKLTETITAVPITRRSDQEDDYTFIDLEDARRVGAESNFKDKDGEITDETKKKKYLAAVADGHISMEMFDRAVQSSRRAEYEELSADFEQSLQEFQSLEKVIDEKFGEAAPNLALCRNTLNQIQIAVSDILGKKRSAEPDAPSEQDGGESASEESHDPRRPVSEVIRVPLSISQLSHGATGGSWRDAEALIRSGQVEKGLTEMARLAASEASGRDRFQRKLLLAEICLSSKRDRLARMILEELNEQIDSYKLESWESPDLIGNVWTRLYRIYKQNGDSSDSERAAKLYLRLCRLDPWQALGCGEG